MAGGSKKEEKKIKSKDTIRRISWGRYLTIFFISAWMFVLGLLVGRGTAPVRFDIKKLSKELEKLRVADMKKLAAPVQIEADEEKTKSTLGFYEELKKSAPAASPTIKPRIGSTKTDAKTQKNNAPVTPTTAKSDNKEAVAKSPSNAQKKPEVKTVAPTADGGASAGQASEHSTEMTIQVASLKTLKDADALVKKLTDRGYPAYKTIAIVPDKGIWFRIRVGRFADSSATNGMLARLKKEGYRPLVVEAK